jgi:uncharacterized LabA/DUF88 family protein
MSTNLTRVAVYIDGFNLYFGLKTSGLRKYYWLDLQKLSSLFCSSDQTLTAVHYFTSRIRAKGTNPDRLRQSHYIDALASQPLITIYEGHFLEKEKTCRSCGAKWITNEEKMTDVNIATRLLVDAFDDKYDRAILVSGDSDLSPPVSAVLERFPQKAVIIANPPNRRSKQLLQAATSDFQIYENKLRNAQFPDSFTASNGIVFTRPAHWR